jgi:hypothetical protein
MRFLLAALLMLAVFAAGMKVQAATTAEHALNGAVTCGAPWQRLRLEYVS